MGAGKRVGATGLSDLTAAPKLDPRPAAQVPKQNLPVFGDEDSASSYKGFIETTAVISPAECDSTSLPNVQNADTNDTVFLYSVEPIVRSLHESQPFIYHVTIRNLKTGTATRVKGLIDDGAMVNVVDADLWQQLVKWLGNVHTSMRNLRMANGNIVASQGRWEGEFDFDGVSIRSSFELFPSKGTWSFLIGKPMLEALRAQHDYEADTIQV